MKKSVKVVIGIICLLAIGAGGIWYVFRPVPAEASRAVRGDLTETLTIQGTVSPGRTAVITATAPGKVERLLYTAGKHVEEGDEVLILDDSSYQEQLADQIASLEKEKANVYTQGNSSQSEIKLRQEQLIGQMEAARQEYRLMFGENGTAVTGEETARNSVEAAEDAYQSAVRKNEKAEESGGEPPYTKDQIGNLKASWENAEEAYENAQLVNSETNRQYYESIMHIYETQFQTLTENGNNGASSIVSAASQVQISIDALKRQQERDLITAPFSGVVWEVLAEEGSYVSQGQELLKLYEDGEKSLEAWLLTEDAVHYKEGDPVRVKLADGTEFTSQILFLSPIGEERVSSLGISENRCLVELDASGIPEQMGAGYEAELVFSYPAAEDVISVPLAAVEGEGEDAAVYVAENGRARKISVKTGTYSGGRVEIVEGLGEGDLVLRNPEEQGIRDGSRVIFTLPEELPEK